MDYNKLAAEIHAANVKKGWHEKPRDFEELILLIQSEVFEAFEAMRKGKFSEKAHTDILFDQWNRNGFFDPSEFLTTIKNTLEDEVADTAIRLMDMAYAKGFEIPPVKYRPRFDKSLFSISAFIGTSGRMYHNCDANQVSVMLGWCEAMAETYDFDLEKHIYLKLQYNKTRPYKHGKKF